MRHVRETVREMDGMLRRSDFALESHDFRQRLWKMVTEKYALASSAKGCMYSNFKGGHIMINQEKVAKLEKILADKAFVDKVLGIETAEDVQKALNEKGLELSMEEIYDIRDAWTKQAEGADEIDAGDLRKVAGGTIYIPPNKPPFSPETGRRW